MVTEAPQNQSAAIIAKDEVIDSIVTVSRPRHKRKRANKKVDGEGTEDDDDDENSQGKKAAKVASTADITPFDYASAPNPLDSQSGTTTKAKQPKG